MPKPTPHDALKPIRTELQVKHLKPVTLPTGKVKREFPTDTPGLIVRLTPTGRTVFIHVFQWNRKTRERVLGEYPGLSLGDARDMRNADRILIKRGKDPAPKGLAAELPDVPTFAQWAIAHAEHLAPASPVHHALWLTEMTEKVGDLAKMPIDDIRLKDVKAIIAPIWKVTPPTAKQRCQRIARVLAHRAANQRPDEPFGNPADLKVIENAIGKRYQHRVRSHPSAEFEAIPGLFAKVRADGVMSARLLEWTILTGCRINEASEARWGEIDLQARTWTIPVDRLKTRAKRDGKSFVVPLSLALVQVLRKVWPSDGKPHPSAPIFPSPRTGRPMRTRVALDCIQRIDPTLTCHGFRASLIGWGTSIPHRRRSEFDRELMEVCLSHRVGTSVTPAYLRTEWADRRRIVMREWSAFCRGRAPIHGVTHAMPNVLSIAA